MRGVAGARRDAEVGEDHPAVVADHDVARLHVAVDDPPRVRGLERAQQRQPDLRRLLRRQRAVVAHDVRERAGLDELHDEERRAVVLDDVVDGDGARVVEPGGGPRLAPGALDEHGAVVVGQPVREGDLLDGDLAVEDLVARPPDGAHAAGAQGRAQPVAPGDEPVRGEVHPVRTPVAAYAAVVRGPRGRASARVPVAQGARRLELSPCDPSSSVAPVASSPPAPCGRHDDRPGQTPPGRPAPGAARRCACRGTRRRCARRRAAARSERRGRAAAAGRPPSPPARPAGPRRAPAAPCRRARPAPGRTAASSALGRRPSQDVEQQGVEAGAVGRDGRAQVRRRARPAGSARTSSGRRCRRARRARRRRPPAPAPARRRAGPGAARRPRRAAASQRSASEVSAAPTQVVEAGEVVGGRGQRDAGTSGHGPVRAARRSRPRRAARPPRRRAPPSAPARGAAGSVSARPGSSAAGRRRRPR